MKINKILIANRGEVVCRIARTCRRLGIQTVAIYSDADAFLPHVHECDEAEYVGESESAHSYLNGDRIIKIALEYGAQAIHPGYGFLSENADFARKVSKAGLVFIGPTPEVIHLLGDKVEAKKAAEAHHVPTVQGIMSATADAKEIKTFATKNGYPILIKAAAGGGGRGMRKVFSEGELEEALTAASREAKSFFSDDRVFVEQYIEHARHIEVQIIGDSHGTVMHLGTRDCTLQRNHQKVIEEAPAPNISDMLREQLHQCAVKLCGGVKYQSAGTVEFLLCGDKFFFLEVNSRLQVEHPVTEAVFGVDLVELQIKIAEGKSLKELLPTTPNANGHAIQCRICTESPRENFLADTGTIRRCDYPSDGFVRVDTGYEIDSEISHYYDSLFAKLIVAGESREQAILRARQSLQKTEIAGVQTNTEFLLALLDNFDFQNVTHSTSTAHDVVSNLSESTTMWIVGLAALIASSPLTSKSSWSTHDGFRLGIKSELNRSLLVNGSRVAIKGSFFGRSSFAFDAPAMSTECIPTSRGISMNTDGTLINLIPYRVGHTLWILGDLGCFKTQELFDPLRISSLNQGHIKREIASPLPGKILSIEAKEGQSIKEGSTLFVMESMKMEHKVITPHTATVKKILVEVGSTVQRDMILCTLE